MRQFRKKLSGENLNDPEQDRAEKIRGQELLRLITSCIFASIIIRRHRVLPWLGLHYLILK